VQKSHINSLVPIRRLLCISESCIIERDPLSYAVICARNLNTVGNFLNFIYNFDQKIFKLKLYHRVGHSR